MRIMFLGYHGDMAVINIESDNQKVIKSVIDSICGGYTGFDTNVMSTPDLKYRYVYNDGIDVKYDYDFAKNKCMDKLYDLKEYFDCVIFKGVPYTNDVQNLTDEDIEYLFRLYGDINESKENR